MPQSYMVYRTATFKLHNPSHHKREVIEHALAEYTNGYRQLLEWAQANPGILEAEGKYETRSGQRRWKPAHVLAEVLRCSGIRPKLHSSLRDALCNDVAGNLCSFYALQESYHRRLATYRARKAQYEQIGDRRKLRQLILPSPPGFPSIPEPLDQVMENLAALGDVDEDKWLACQSQLIRSLRSRFRSLFFHRPDAVPSNAGFSLLADDVRDRYYALLFLLPAKHQLGQLLETAGNLRRVGCSTADNPEMDHAPLYLSSHSRCAILCPLEMGHQQAAKFLDNSDSHPVLAYLAEHDSEYFLSVVFRTSVPAIGPDAVLGVHRGLAGVIGLRVLDFEGNRLHEELWIGDEFPEYRTDCRCERRRLEKRGNQVAGDVHVERVSERTAHAMANRIAELARQYQAQVVFEDVRHLDRSFEIFYRLSIASYLSIAHKLDYKLPSNGLPEPELTSPAYVSVMCPRCSFSEKANWQSNSIFRCGHCGYEDHPDLNAATNLAQRWLAAQRGERWWPINRPRKT